MLQFVDSINFLASFIDNNTYWSFVLLDILALLLAWLFTLHLLLTFSIKSAKFTMEILFKLILELVSFIELKSIGILLLILFLGARSLISGSSLIIFLVFIFKIFSLKSSLSYEILLIFR